MDKKSHEGELPVRLCNYMDVYQNDVVSPSTESMPATATADEVDRFRLLVGDTIITKDSEDPADIGVSATVLQSADDFVCGYHLAILRPLSNVHPRYLTWTIRSSRVKSHFTSQARGMTRFGLSLDTVKSAPIVLRDLPEQRRIADFLDDRVARIDNIIAARRRQVAALTGLMAAKLQAMVDAAVERVGTVSMRYALDAIEQGWSPQAEDTPAADNEWAVMRAGCLGYGAFDATDHKRLPDGVSPRCEFEIASGDLLMSRASGSLDRIGVAAVVPPGTRQRLILCDKLYRLRPTAGWDPTYIAAMVRARSNRDLIRLGVSGAEGMANNLPSGVIKALHLPRLSEHEQQDMMKAVATCEGHVQSMIEALERSIELLTEYKQSLITAAVTGELDVTTAGSGIPA